jgi:hypothetical protein
VLLLSLWGWGGAGNVNAQERTLRIRAVDADSGQALPARLSLRSAQGEHVHFEGDGSPDAAVRYEKRNWLNRQSYEHHTTLAAGPAVATVAPGAYQLSVHHGKSYLPQQLSLAIDQHDLERTVRLKRWANPQQRGWYSGDTHLHRDVRDLRNVILAEDLNVAFPFTFWVTEAGRAPRRGDQNAKRIPTGLVAVDPQHVIWPRNTEYEIFSVGERRHPLGALFVLGHRGALDVSVPPWKPVIEATLSEQPDVLFDMDKLDWPFAMVLPTLAPHALYELANNHVWRVPFAFRDWNSAAPPFLQPPFGAAAGGHRPWLDYTHGMYYTLLNCGLRLPPSAGTANGVHPVPAGFSRVYVHLPEGFEFRRWMRGLKAGRSFVTTGPMLYATADDSDPGHVFESQSATEIPLRGEVISQQPLSYGELLLNGRPVQLLRPQNEATESGAFRSTFDLRVTPQRSGWFALRFWEPRPDGQSRFVHSAPWYVEIDGQPVRPSPAEKRYLVERMEAEIARSRDVLSEAAIEEYERGLAFYRALPELDDRDRFAAEARPVTGETLSRWLDNMVLDHRFTPEEIRGATGMSLAEAKAAIAERAGRQADSGVRMRPYPGGRHPRIGFLEGAVEPRRETKVSVFPPWDDGGYVVVDVPEAVFTNLGLTFLAHQHIPTIWDERGIELPPLEWQREGDRLVRSRTLPNGIRLDSEVAVVDGAARMTLRLTNHTDTPLTGMRVQVCAMLKGALGFNVQEPLQQVVEPPMIAIRGRGATNRWLITAWQPNHRVWSNPPVPCVHSDPRFPDAAPGETVSARGWLWFYQGDQVSSEMRRLREKHLEAAVEND